MADDFSAASGAFIPLHSDKLSLSQISSSSFRAVSENVGVNTKLLESKWVFKKFFLNDYIPK